MNKIRGIFTPRKKNLKNSNLLSNNEEIYKGEKKKYSGSLLFMKEWTHITRKVSSQGYWFF
jgi:hypothetical protein